MYRSDQHGPRHLNAGVVALGAVSFFVHFVWEMWQVPFYQGMSSSSHGEVVWLCTRATLGDVVIALTALVPPVLVFRRGLARLLVLRAGPLLLYLATGLVVTMGLEYHATEIADRWQCKDLMPRLPVLGTGLLPLLQWLVLPVVTLFSAAVFARGWPRA